MLALICHTEMGCKILPATQFVLIIFFLKQLLSHKTLLFCSLFLCQVSTPHSSSIILDSFPPSQAFFNRSLDPVLTPLLRFLQSTSSPLFLNVYPYYDYMESNGVIPLDYALFRALPPNKEAVDANTLLHYTNVFDALVDAAYFAMAYLNVTNVQVVVLESGWPHKGDPSTEPDATTENADTYNSNLVRHVINSTGTYIDYASFLKEGNDNVLE